MRYFGILAAAVTALFFRARIVCFLSGHAAPVRVIYPRGWRCGRCSKAFADFEEFFDMGEGA